MNKKLILLAFVLAVILIAGCSKSKTPSQETTDVISDTAIQETETLVLTEYETTTSTENLDPAESNKTIAPPKPTEKADSATENPESITNSTVKPTTPSETNPQTPPATESSKPEETNPLVTEVTKPTEEPVIDLGDIGENGTAIG